MKLVAITGSIGCGKTTLASLVRGLGYNVYDVDGWVRHLYYQKDFIKTIADAFPSVIENNKVNKRKLRNIVFDDNKKLKHLEGLIHPFLSETLKKSLRRSGNYISFIDVALLFEMGWDKYCDLIIVVDVDYHIQKQRVMDRDHVSAEHFDKINNVQMSGKAKKALADIVINTDKPLNLLRLEIVDIIKGMEQ